MENEFGEENMMIDETIKEMRNKIVRKDRDFHNFKLRLRHMDGYNWYRRDTYDNRDIEDLGRFINMVFNIDFVLIPRIEEHTKSKL